MNAVESKGIAVVVFANRKDFFLTKICVSSIRYFYPTVEIFLVKDKLNGDFNSRRLEKAFNVKLLDLGKNYYGWSAAKIHFLLNQTLPKKRYLCLDSDIIFVGKVIDKLQRQTGDFVLHATRTDPPFSRELIELYVDPEEVKVFYPDYEYPGYFFNAGQTLVTPGLLTEELLKFSFDPKIYPYYKNQETFRLVDQAVLNAVIPVLAKRENVSIDTLDYMEWSVSFFEKPERTTFQYFQNGTTEYLVHYAGDIRTTRLEKMKGADLLLSFRNNYQSRLSKFSRFLDSLQDNITSLSFFTSFLYKCNRVKILLGTFHK